MLRALALLLTTLCAPAAWAHPHVFVDVTLRFLPDAEGRLTGVEVTWAYDDFFSLLVLEDRGLDADGDMILTEAERAAGRDGGGADRHAPCAQLRSDRSRRAGGAAL